MSNIDQEVGFLKGQQSAMQEELKEIKADVKEVTARLGHQDSKLSTIDGKLDGLVAAIKNSDKHPIRVTTQIETEGQSSGVQSSIVSKVLRSQALPWFLCMVIVLIAFVLCFSALTGRNASDFVPARPEAK